MSQLKFSVSDSKCTKCDACVNDCPAHIIERKDSVPYIPAASEECCIQCQHCLAVCPNGAISIFGLKPENSLPIKTGSLPSYKQMKVFARGRRSVRQFRPENVPTAQITELLADLAHAPTGCNDRDLVFSVVDNRKDIERLLTKIVAAIEADTNPSVPEFLRRAAAAFRQNGTDGFFRGSPHLLVVSPGNNATCAHEDAVLALSYFELLAQSAGLGTTWCGMLKITADAVAAIRPLLGLEPDKFFFAMMFGLPSVKYARTVQRDSAATVRRITCK